jgi:hypothetical protein
MVGYCTSIRVGRGGNMLHISREVLSILCCICLLYAYSLSLPCYKLSYELTGNFGIHVRVVRSSRTVYGHTGIKMAENLLKLFENLQAEIINLQAQVSSSGPNRPRICP